MKDHICSVIFISVRHDNNALEACVPAFLLTFFKSNYRFLRPSYLLSSVSLCLTVSSSACLCQYGILVHLSWPSPLHRSTCPITTGLHSCCPLPEPVPFNTERQDSSNGNKKTYPGLSSTPFQIWVVWSHESFGTEQSVLRRELCSEWFWGESCVPSGLTPNTCSQVNTFLYFLPV
jgi:hypothetical protein